MECRADVREGTPDVSVAELATVTGPQELSTEQLSECIRSALSEELLTTTTCDARPQSEGFAVDSAQQDDQRFSKRTQGLETAGVVEGAIGLLNRSTGYHLVGRVRIPACPV